MSLAPQPFGIGFGLLGWEADYGDWVLGLGALAFGTGFGYGLGRALALVEESAAETERSAADPCDHRYEDLSLDELYAHTFQEHFEVWNRCAESGDGRRIRNAHARDHGRAGARPAPGARAEG